MKVYVAFYVDYESAELDDYAYHSKERAERRVNSLKKRDGTSQWSVCGLTMKDKEG
jgi:hypothetical protein